MKKLSEYTSKDGKFVHQAKAGRYGGSKPSAPEPTKGPSNKQLDQLKKSMKKEDSCCPKCGKMHEGECKMEGVDEKLVGNQHKLDHNKNGKLDAHDFKMARKKKGETATMNPKMDNNSKNGGSMEQKEGVKSADKEPEAYTDPSTGKTKYRMVAKDKDMIKQESTIRQRLLSIFEKKEDPHTKGSLKQPPLDNVAVSGKGAKDMVAQHNPVIPKGGDEPALEKDNFSNMTKDVKKSPMRPNDNPQGDKNIINPVDDITKKASKKEDDGFKQGGAPKIGESFLDQVVAASRKLFQ